MGGSVLVLSSSTGANIQELEASPDVPIAPLVLEFLTSNFYGNETEWGYGFTFAADERGHMSEVTTALWMPRTSLCAPSNLGEFTLRPKHRNSSG